ncbi:MAG TPA: polysaccharide lyase [Alphaproteobacteria bacterium]|nr:polysaccharide lyase [Alphaproteobacteria bacterium]
MGDAPILGAESLSKRGRFARSALLLIAGAAMTAIWPMARGRAADGGPPSQRAIVPLIEYRAFRGPTLDGWSRRRLREADSAVIEAMGGRENAIRVTLRPGDYVSEGWRAELADIYHAPIGRDLWYGFSTYIPADYPVGEDNICVLAQWHDQANPGEPAHKPMLAHRYNKGVFYVSHDGPGIRQIALYREAGFARGTWHDFIYHIRWSEQPDGYIDGWIDGRNVVHFHGTTMYPGQKLGPYFKLGVYCAHDVKTPHIAYHADYSRGGAFAEVDPARAGELLVHGRRR